MENKSITLHHLRMSRYSSLYETTFICETVTETASQLSLILAARSVRTVFQTDDSSSSRPLLAGNVPVDVLHAIYGDLPGAVFDNDTSFYNISCDTKMNISFIFGYVFIARSIISSIDCVQPEELNIPFTRWMLYTYLVTS